MSGPTLCAIPGCRINGRHLPSCDADERNPCPGCLPRLAEDGLCCDTHVRWTEEALAEIQRLAPDAEAVARGEVRRGSGGGSGKPGSRPPINVDARDALDQTHAKLARACIRIARPRGMRFHVPCLADCVRPTPSQAHCSVCHETFAGPTLFDAHCRGDVEARYCLDPEEMTDRGEPLRKDVRGVWRSGAVRPETGSVEPQTADESSVVAEPTAEDTEPVEALTGGQP